MIAAGAAVAAAVAVPPLVGPSVAVSEPIEEFLAPLNASLRWAFGHWPHLDYPTPVGVAYWLNQGLAVTLVGLGAKTALVANILAAILLATCGYFLIRPRLPAWLSVLMLTAVAVLVVSPRAVGDGPATVSFAGADDKVGLALLALLFTAYLVEARYREGAAIEAMRSLVAMFLLVWLAYLRLDLAVLAVLCGLGALYLSPDNRGLVIESASVAVPVAVVIGFLTGLGLPYLQDLAGAAASLVWPAQAEKLLDDLRSQPLSVALFVIAVGASSIIGRRTLGPRDLAVGLLLFVIAALAVNRAAGHGLPLTFAALVVLAGRALAAAPGGEAAAGWRRVLTSPGAPLLAAAAVLVAHMIALDLLTVKNHAGARQQGRTAVLCGDPALPACSIAVMPPLPEAGGTVLPQDDACETGAPCADPLWHGELRALLAPLLIEGDRPLLLGTANLLPYFFDLEPPRHAPDRMAFGRTLTLDRHPDADSLFADATLVIVPKSDRVSVHEPALWLIYADDISDRFEPLTETDVWRVWRRRPRSG